MKSSLEISAKEDIFAYNYYNRSCKKLEINNMRSLFNIFLAIVISLIMTACNKSSDNFLKVSPDALYFDGSASSQTVVITCGDDWEIIHIPEWCSVSSVSGQSGKDVSISVSENDGCERSSELLIISGKLSAPIKITQFAKIKTNYIDLKLNDNGTSYSYDEKTGILTLKYDSSIVPQILAGQAIVLPYEYNFNIRLIETVSVSDTGEIILSTTQGDMGDLFYDTKFALSITESPDLKSSNKLPVFFPSFIGYVNDNGEYIEVPYDITSKAYKFEKFQSLCAIHKDWDGETIIENGAGKMFWEKCSIEATLDGYFQFEFERGVKYFSGCINGNLLMDFLLHYNYTKEFSKSYDKIIANDIINPKVITFTVSGVPIYIYITTDLGNSLSFSIDGKLDFSSGITMTGDMNTEISWSREEGADVRTRFNSSYDIHYPSLGISASASAKVSYYPHISVMFYGIGGPWVEPRPYLKENIDVGTGISLDGDIYAGWQAQTMAGVDIKAGLNLEFLNKQIANWESKVKPVCECVVFDAPNKVSITHPQTDTIVGLNQSVNVKCLTESYSPITHSHYVCYPVIVKVTDEYGNMRYMVSRSSDGLISFDWIPFTEDNIQDVKYNDNLNILHLSIEAPNGDVISEDNLVVKLGSEGDDDNKEEDEDDDKKEDEDDDKEKDEEDNEGHKWVQYLGEPIDLGLSVKWGSCNFGASNKEEYGLYYAWGELDPKVSYNTSTYLYHDMDIYQCLGDEISGTNFDAVAQRFGYGWRMPTYDEIYGLLEMGSMKESSNNGIEGVTITGPNGNEIFIPAAGYMLNDFCVNDGVIIGCWSGTFESYRSEDGVSSPTAYALLGTDAIPMGSPCVMGLPIRPVKD